MLVMKFSKDRRERRIKRGLTRNQKRFFGGGGSSGGSSAPTNTTTVNKTEPWEGQKPVLEDVYKQTQAAYNATAKNPYTGQLLADPNALQRGALDARLSLADQLSGAGNNLYNLGQNTAAGTYLNPSSNPALQASISASLNPVSDKFKNEILPGISSAAQEQGAYGGARHGLALAQAGQLATREMSDIAAKIGYENYARERALQLQAPSLISSGLQLMDMPTTIREGVGNVQQMWSQDELDKAYQQWQMQQQAPWIGLPEYAGIVQNGSFGGSTVGSANYAGGGGSNRFQGALMGGLGGAGLGYLGASALGVEAAAGATGLAAAAPFAPYLLGGAVLGGLAGGLF